MYRDPVQQQLQIRILRLILLTTRRLRHLSMPWPLLSHVCHISSTGRSPRLCLDNLWHLHLELIPSKIDKCLPDTPLLIASLAPHLACLWISGHRYIAPNEDFVKFILACIDPLTHLRVFRMNRNHYFRELKGICTLSETITQQLALCSDQLVWSYDSNQLRICF